MKTQIKNWACALLPLLLILALLLYFNVERRYTEADITPELCTKLVCHELRRQDNAPKPEDVQIVGIQKVDDKVFAGYCLAHSWNDEPEFGYLDFLQYKEVYRVLHCYRGVMKVTAQIAYEQIHTKLSNGERFRQILIMSVDEEFRRMEFWRRQSAIYAGEEDSYTLLNSIDIPKGPVRVISPYESGWYAKMLIVDAAGREIARR